jgi:hypothetical protein
MRIETEITSKPTKLIQQLKAILAQQVQENMVEEPKVPNNS